MVARMENLVTISKSRASIKVLDFHKTRSKKERSKLARGVNRGTLSLVATTTDGANAGVKVRRNANASTSTTILKVPRKKLGLHKRKNPFVHVKKLHLPTDLIISRSFRNIPKAQLSANVKAKVTAVAANDDYAPAKKMSPIKHPTGIFNSKSIMALNPTKSTMINIVQLMQEQYQTQNSAVAVEAGPAPTSFGKTAALTASKNVATTTDPQRRGRKRKAAYEFIEPVDNTESVVRKRMRIPKDDNNEANAAATTTGNHTNGSSNSNRKDTLIDRTLLKNKKATKKGVKQSRIFHRNNKNGAMERSSPPLTRARLRQMTNVKLLEALDYHHRTI